MRLWGGRTGRHPVLLEATNVNQTQPLPQDISQSLSADPASAQHVSHLGVVQGNAPACRRVLVVEDHPLLRFALIDALIGQGYECYGAEHGLAALALLGKTRVDLVVTDLNMPHMGGIELLMHLGAWPTTQAIPVVVVTAHVSDELRLRILRAGAKAVVERSVRSDEILASVRASLDGPAPAPQPPLAPAL